MLHLTYLQNSGGRSGHSLGDIVTVFILKKLLEEFNPAVLFHASWLSQKIISPEAFKSSCAEPLALYDETLEVSHKKFPLPFVDGAGGDQSHWQGWCWDDFMRFRKMLVALDPFNKNILVRASFGCKIHLQSVKEWYLSGLLKKDIYKPIVSTLRKLYHSDHSSDPIRAIAIHIRAGDLAWKWKHTLGYDYYAKIITALTSRFNWDINVYCEDLHAESYIKLDKLKNTTVFAGGLEELERDINMMVRSSVLFLSPCSAASLCGHLCRGLVLIDKTIITTHRPNVFRESEAVFEVFNTIEDKITLIGDHIKNDQA